jgi:hypothetical protein
MILRQCVTHKDQVMKPPYHTSATEPPHQEIFRVAVSRDQLQHLPIRCLVDLVYSFHPDCFMGSHLVEFIPKSIELLLLDLQTACWLNRGLIPQPQAHPLRLLALLQLSKLNQLREGPQLNPAYRTMR